MTRPEQGPDASPHGQDSSTRRWVAFAAPIGALVVAALLFLFRDPVLRSVELPVAYLMWAARVAAVVIGQRVAWAVLVVLAAAYGLASLRTRRTPRGRPAAPQRREGLRTRISYWESCLSRDRESWLSRQLLAADLRRLAVRVLAHTDGLDASELESGPQGADHQGAGPQSGGSTPADLPACLRSLFDREREQPPARLGPLARLFRRGRRADRAGARDAAEIVGALEARLNLLESNRSERSTER